MLLPQDITLDNVQIAIAQIVGQAQCLTIMGIPIVDLAIQAMHLQIIILVSVQAATIPMDGKERFSITVEVLIVFHAMPAMHHQIIIHTSVRSATILQPGQMVPSTILGSQIVSLAIKKTDRKITHKGSAQIAMTLGSGVIKPPSPEQAIQR
jgi:hypothetical protein